MPWEYVKLILCRDVFHCTPVELNKVSMRDIADTLLCLRIEADIKNARAGMKK